MVFMNTTRKKRGKSPGTAIRKRAIKETMLTKEAAITRLTSAVELCVKRLGFVLFPGIDTPREYAETIWNSMERKGKTGASDLEQKISDIYELSLKIRFDWLGRMNTRDLDGYGYNRLADIIEFMKEANSTAITTKIETAISAFNDRLIRELPPLASEELETVGKIFEKHIKLLETLDRSRSVREAGSGYKDDFANRLLDAMVDAAKQAASVEGGTAKNQLLLIRFIEKEVYGTDTKRAEVAKEIIASEMGRLREIKEIIDRCLQLEAEFARKSQGKINMEELRSLNERCEQTASEVPVLCEEANRILPGIFFKLEDTEKLIVVGLLMSGPGGKDYTDQLLSKEARDLVGNINSAVAILPNNQENRLRTIRFLESQAERKP